MATTSKEKTTQSFERLKGEFGYTNPNQAPRLLKVVINTGTGSISDQNKLDIIVDRLTKITGQKPAPRAGRKSIATLRSRQGDVVGYQVTLRRAQMYGFLDKLIHIALPRTKDFRGISRTAVDEMGNMTIGIKEHTIFPETADEDVRNVFGFAVTVVSTASNKKEAEKFFELIGFPLRASE